MVRLRHLTGILAVGILVSAAIAFADGPVYKHSGSVLAYDPVAGTLVLGEVGPWQIERGHTKITERRIELTDKTEIVFVWRAPVANGLEGDFVEDPLPRDLLMLDDFVTVECEHRGARMIARRILVMDVELP